MKRDPAGSATGSLDSHRFEISSNAKIRILIVRLSAMGDVIHTLPAVQALRDALPKAHIGWLIEERWAELLCAAGTPRRGPLSSQRPLVDEVHTVRLKDWEKSLFSFSSVQRIATVWNDVRGGRYDAAIDLQGAIRSALLARFSGARIVFGAAEPREAPASLWYSRKILAAGKHVVQQNLSVAHGVMREIGVQPENEAPGVTLLPRDLQAEERIDRRLEEFGIGAFAILNPGAGWGAKRWPARRYGEVARELSNRGLRSILNYGPGEDDLVHAAEEASSGAAVPMKSTLTELIALTRRARLFVGGDTGPLHLAAALKIPVVGIYGPTDPVRNGPYGTRSVVLRSTESVTSHARNAAPDEFMQEISSQDVVAAAAALLP